jgi:hypothetical protein
MRLASNGVGGNDPKIHGIVVAQGRDHHVKGEMNHPLATLYRAGQVGLHFPGLAKIEGVEDRLKFADHHRNLRGGAGH